MWYHWVATIIGVYAVGSAIYNMVYARDQAGMIINGVWILIGAGMLYFGITGIRTPTYSAPVSYGQNPFATQQGGRRRRH